MQFVSYGFLLYFAPTVIIGFNLIRKHSIIMAERFVLFVSFLFYGFYGIDHFVRLAVNILFNFLFIVLIKIIKERKRKKVVLAIGIIGNIGILLFYKYTNFFIEIFAEIKNVDFMKSDIILPIGISFYTFQQIAYLIDTYHNETDKDSLLDYLFYIMYFPKLLMGPITTRDKLLTQIHGLKKNVDFNQIAIGIQIFVIGLVKKMLLADTLAGGVKWCFDNYSKLTSGDIFILILLYTFQIYFDFSSYSDMAVGISRCMGIELPINFDSPYKALSIREFWRRWHISLSGFFEKYLYIPLGGNRKGMFRTCLNVIIVFMVSGLWHGANFTFLLWGILHGFLSVIERLFHKRCKNIHSTVKWLYSFSVTGVLWLLFRSRNVAEWVDLLWRMCRLDNMMVSDGLIASVTRPGAEYIYRILHLSFLNENIRGFSILILLSFSFLACLCFENGYKRKYNNRLISALIVAFLFTICLLNMSYEAVFIYNSF